MPIDILTVSAASSNPPGQPKIFFDAKSTSSTSATFLVNKEPWYIEVYNLGGGDTVTVQQVMGSGSGTVFKTFSPLNVPYKLTATQSKIRIDWPGYYRLVFVGAAVNAITCAGFEGTMTHESVFGVSPANGGPGANAVVVGTAPIVVTGTGGSGSPYTISALNTDIATGAAGILNAADAGKLAKLGADGSINTSLLGWDYLDLGTITNGTLEVHWATSRAQKVTSNSGGVLNVNFTGLSPTSPCLCFLSFNQASGAIDTIVFAGGLLINAWAVTAPGFDALAETLYTFYWDGNNYWLVDFSSNGFAGPGRFKGSSSTVVCGDNINRSVTSLLSSNPTYGAATGTNTYAVSFSPAITQYYTGVVYNILFANANSGAATLNINGVGAAAIQRRNVAVTAGQIPAGSTLGLLYNGVAFQITGAA